MRLTANRKALAEAAQNALVPAATNHLPILGCLRLDAEGASVTVTGTNLDVTITAEVSAEVHQQGSVIVPGRILADLLKSMGDEVVTIDTIDDFEIEMVCGSAQVSLRCQKLEDWPKVGNVDAEPCELGPLDVARLGAVLRAVASDAKALQNRPVIGGIHFSESRAEATDGSVFVLATLSASDMPGVVVPGPLVARVIKASPEGVTAAFGSRAVTFTSSDGTISWTSRYIEGEYPDMVRWLRADSQHALTIERAALARKLTVMKSLAESGDFTPVDLTFADDLLVLSARRTDVGNVRDEVPCTSTFEFPMRFHLQFLGLLCDLLDGDDVTFEVEDAMKPIIARTEDWRLAVIVGPMKPPAAT